MSIPENVLSRLYCISKNSSVYDASRMMTSLKIGAIIVGSPEQMLGIISERDIMTRVVSHELQANQVSVDSIMKKPLIRIQDSATPDEALQLMAMHQIRHLPVANQRGIGLFMISSRDLLQHKVESLDEEKAYLMDYLNTDPYQRYC